MSVSGRAIVRAIVSPRSTGPLNKQDDEKLKIYHGDESLAELTQQPVNGTSAPQDRALKPPDEMAPPAVRASLELV